MRQGHVLFHTHDWRLERALILLTGGLDGLLGIKAGGVWDVKGSQKVIKIWSLHVPHGWMPARAATGAEHRISGRQGPLDSVQRHPTPITLTHTQPAHTCTKPHTLGSHTPVLPQQVSRMLGTLWQGWKEKFMCSDKAAWQALNISIWEFLGGRYPESAHSLSSQGPASPRPCTLAKNHSLSP